MKKLQLNELKVSSFSTESKSSVKGGAPQPIQLQSIQSPCIVTVTQAKGCRPSFTPECWISECPTSCCPDSWEPNCDPIFEV